MVELEEDIDAILNIEDDIKEYSKSKTNSNPTEIYSFLIGKYSGEKAGIIRKILGRYFKPEEIDKLEKPVKQNGLEKIAIGKETIQSLKEDIGFYSKRDLTPNDVYLLITKQQKYSEINSEIILLTIESILGKEYASKINTPKSPEQYLQNAEIHAETNYEPENLENSEHEISESTPESTVVLPVQKPKRKISKKGLIIGLTAFLAIALPITYVVDRKCVEYQRNKRLKQQEELRIAEERERQEEIRIKSETRVTRNVYVGQAICNECHGTGKITCWVCNGTKIFSYGDYTPERQVAVTCSYCKGTGYSHGRICYVCNGNGRILETRNAIDRRRTGPCSQCKDKTTGEPTGLVNCLHCKGTGYYGKQMAKVVYDGFGNAKDTLKKWTE